MFAPTQGRTPETPDVTVPATALQNVMTELQRADGKAGTMTGIAGAALALIATLAHGQTGPARWLLAAGIAALAVTIVACVLVIAPALLGASGFDAHHTATRAEVERDLLDAEPGLWLVEQYRTLTGIARAKFVRLRVACWSFVVAVAVITTAAILVTVGG